jgi:hypothetical protein
MSSLIYILDFLVLLSFAFSFSAIRDHQRRRGLSYPPGPRPLPVIGNLLDIPKRLSWLAYIKFSKKYGKDPSLVFFLSKDTLSGDVLSFHVFGQVIIVLNSVKATKDLLERRGEIYSDRPVVPFYDMWGREFYDFCSLGF